MGPFPSSSGNKYILVAIDYVSKWVEAQAFPASDARNVVNFLKRLFARFRIPKALISDRGTHFCNYQMERAMKRYGVVHRFSTAYHPQTNGRVKNTNISIKRIVEKTIGNNRKEWSHKLDDALWAFRNALKTPLGMTLFRIIYGKACHLLVELENKAYWAIKACNIDLTKAGANRFLQINELDELRLDANESSISYKERTKRWHDKRIKTQTKYKKGDKVLLFNSRLRLFLRKLKSRWYRPFAVSKDMKNGAIELYDEDGNEFIVNKQRVKPYQKNTQIIDKDDDITLEDEGGVTTIPEKELDEFIKSSVEDLVLIPSESEDTSDSDEECDLPFCDNSVTFSNPLINDNDDFTSINDELPLEEDIQEENFKIYLFEFDEEYISSDVNPLLMRR
ncbi:reverse transcriptase domain-containing protein [Tanacetum coccineum]